MSALRKRTNTAEPVTGLGEEEKVLLFKALCLLRKDRGRAWNTACDVEEAQGKRPPSLHSYGIDEIRRLARRLGLPPTHWMEE